MILNPSSCILTIDSRLRGNEGRFCKGLSRERRIVVVGFSCCCPALHLWIADQVRNDVPGICGVGIMLEMRVAYIGLRLVLLTHLRYINHGVIGATNATAQVDIS